MITYIGTRKKCTVARVMTASQGTTVASACVHLVTIHTLCTKKNHQRVLKCTGSSGSFKIKFRGQKTLQIFAYDTKEQVKEKLEALSTIDSVKITFTEANAFSVCTAGGTNIVIITFLSQTGGSPWMDQFFKKGSVISTRYLHRRGFQCDSGPWPRCSRESL